MDRKLGFDRERYITLQSEHINARREEIGGKLYLEMGGKLFDDHHAARVLPGFTPDNKIEMLEQIRDDVEIIICINSHDLERGKVRADLGIPYDEDTLRLIDVFRDRGFLVDHVVMTQFEDGNQRAWEFKERLENLGLKVSRHFVIEGYPSNIDKVVSDEGLGRNEWVETSRDVIVVTAPGPGSGKLATSLSQVYQDNQRGIKAGYAKFETFPVWNLPLEHPVNLAYEAATVDLNDSNVIDPFHLKAHGEYTVNYNRDVEAFPLLKSILARVTGTEPYQSPTDMGVNMVGNCIIDDEVCREASIQEIIRRYYRALVDERRLDTDDRTYSDRAAVVMAKADCSTADRAVVAPALEIEERTGGLPGSAMQLHDGTIVTGKTTELLGCSAGMLLNALKHLAGIDRELHLLSPSSIEPIQTLKTQHLGSQNPRLHTDEVLIALSVSAADSPEAQRALAELRNLRGTDAHTSTILGPVDEGIFRNLGVNVTSEPRYWKKRLYRKR
ncbi:hypothetical protein C3B44_11320 [Corynebacterium yudongzhengii]|uniref:UPF0371 protein DF222_11105 n=1 Tax=Corynebacterium yudongzhengii TaxID=2080740 RepID=A0A2U1T442_9CORY|nr:DUF1846 domain-containing protein [Corynebacterium yudongzhengii]AWB82845.1 hypothetical protein C3B44_11320 [Corynebacterium yudongzhengii]PWC00752.1 DUF1846 domain-containing protein [Corynebacterium yudongzhengii]